MSDTAIKIINLHKKYEDEIYAVQGIDLLIKKGEFYGLLGPKGSITVFNKDIVSDFRYTRSKIGIAPQEISNDWFFSVEQLLYFQAGFYGIERKNAKERIEYILHKVGLYDHKDKKMRQLSGGMKRRLQIARALVTDPEILILDEPTAGVDVALRHDLWDFLQQLHKGGKTILLTTHYIDEAELLCERVGIINNGKLIAEDTVPNLKSSIDKSKLEDVFLELTGRTLND